MGNCLEKFGEIFIRDVRDNTIETFEEMFAGSMGGFTAKEVRDKTSLFDEQQKSNLLWLITKAIDQSIFNMLFMLEEHEEIKIFYNEEDLAQESDGLSGELYTEDGWIKKYSEKIFKD